MLNFLTSALLLKASEAISQRPNNTATLRDKQPSQQQIIPV